jgi:hypothetical protein
MNTPSSYKVLCAWCLKEGVETVTRESSVPFTSGICPRHAKDLEEEGLRAIRDRKLMEGGEA